MSFNKCYVSEPSDLIKEIEKTGANQTYLYYKKVESFIGSSESIAIVRELVLLVRENKSDDEILLKFKEKYPDLFKPSQF